MWERVSYEQEMLPNPEALKLHWTRCFWVFKFWSQANANFLNLPSLSDYGWQICNGNLSFIWDTDSNFKKVEATVDWYTKGCSCKTGSKTNECKCLKSKKKCDASYKCVSYCNLNDISF